MAEKSDLETLAERYLDLWQDQVTAMAADTDLAAAFQGLMPPGGLAAGGAAPLAAWQAMMAACGAPAPPAREPKANESSTGQDSAAAASGTAAASPASGRGGNGLDDVARRLAALEDRIAALEGQSGKKSTGSKRVRTKGTAGRKRS